MRNKTIHLLSLAATKTADGLIDPKLVLSWALGAAGAPAYVIGMLVPIRESLAMLPQIWLAAFLQSWKFRKYAWCLGSFIEALSVFAIAIVLLTLEGAAAGWWCVLLIAIFALGRSLASVSYKEVLGKTVEKGARGTVPGLAGSIASALVLAFGAAFATGLIALTLENIIWFILLAAGLWLMASGLFSLLDEGPSDTDEDNHRSLRAIVVQIRDDPQLGLFTFVRSLLTVTALAPPFVLSLAGEQRGDNLSSLGWFVIASAMASVLGSTVWGVMSDKSSRLVLIVAASISAALFVFLALLAGIEKGSGLSSILLPVCLFCLMLAYQGVRLGRSTHVVDMAPEGKRSGYAAVSNTIVGLLLLGGGVFGLVAEWAGLQVLFCVFGVLSLTGALLALKLKNVQS